MQETLDDPAAVRPRPTGTVHDDLDATIDLVARALEQLRVARRRSRQGIRVAGPDGDDLRATVAALVTDADADLHHARVVLDRQLRTASAEGLAAPRPVIELPPGD